MEASYAQRAAAHADRAARTGDPGDMAAAQVYAALALVESVDQVNDHLRSIVSWMDHLSGVLHSPLGSLADHAEAIRHRLED
ncbi:MAG TPA: hypothetical protein VE546_14080 [Streptomyces sp.]|uniref:hypothetical protein n=1 Tax=Streptomyces sp. TaxID=1931 RepID=UPI002D7200A6|nr:hypothetical protein [Streptomyces sp.]HZG04676.1 hypothetical protein [Streptomyces sp.]